MNNLDPANCHSDDEVIVRSIFGSLIRNVGTTNQKTPEWANHSAIRLEPLNDMRYKFTLRSGMKWGGTKEEVTAEDLRYSVERVAKSGLHRNRWSQLERVDVSSKLDGDIRLRHADPEFIAAALLHGSACFVSKKAIEQLPDKGFTTQPPTSAGRYRLAEVRYDEYVKLECDGSWNGAAPKYREVKFVIIPNDDVAEAAVRSGEIDVLRIDPDHLNRMSPGSYQHLQLVSLSSLVVSYLAISSAAKPLDDVRVRTAVQRAIDAGALVEGVYGKFASRATGLLPSVLAGARTKNLLPDRNEQEARKLLREAGLAGGFSTELFLWGGGRGLRALAEGIVDALRKVAINVKIADGNPQQAAQSGPVPLVLARRAVPPSGRLILQSFQTKDGLNFGQYASAEYDGQLAGTVTMRDRQEAYRLLQDRLETAAVVLPLAEERATWLLRKGVTLPFTRYGTIADLGDATFKS